MSRELILAKRVRTPAVRCVRGAALCHRQGTERGSEGAARLAQERETARVPVYPERDGGGVRSTLAARPRRVPGTRATRCGGGAARLLVAAKVGHS